MSRPDRLPLQARLSLLTTCCLLGVSTAHAAPDGAARKSDLQGDGSKAAGLLADAPPVLPDGEELEEVTVSGERIYRRRNAGSATRTDTALRDTPASVQVVPQQVIEDQQVTRLDEALRNVSGVTFNGLDTGTDGRFSIRGFENVPLLQDGFRQYNLVGLPETANLERVEVLKGPASVLYGEAQPGGVINAVTKQPTATPLYSAELQAGSFGLVRPRLDLGGPVSADGTLRYRLNTVFESKASFRNYTQQYRKFFVAPVFAWQLDERTRLNLELQYQYSERPWDGGTVALGTGVVRVPRERTFNEPDDFIRRNFLNTGLTLSHRFSDNWSLKSAFRFTENRIYSDKLTIPIFFDEASGTLGRVFAFDDFRSRDYSLQNALTGKFSTGTIDHTLLLAVDLNRNDFTQVATGDLFNPTLINVFNPVYRAVPRPDKAQMGLLFDQQAQTDRLGVVVQDQLSFSPDWKLLASLRYDSVRQKVEDVPALFTPTGLGSFQYNDAFTPRLGTLYRPLPQLGIFVSYARSFNPSVNAFAFDGLPLPPERGEGYEAGLKADLGANLSATLAFYDLTRRNVPTPDPAFPGLGFVLATGEQRSRGVELDLAGQILPGWNVIGFYSYIDAQVSRDSIVPVGNRLPGVPEHSASLWSTYQLQSGAAQGLGFGLGFNYVGERAGDLDNTFYLNSHFLTNAAVFYGRGDWRLAVNFKNLFDVDYIDGTPIGRVSAGVPGEPFTVIGSVSARF
ncbi:TonB-dependent siderophore receptor [Gloeobacter violaceus]|uniref:Gll0361 protein n=1 Tax=Gloeobacter violaceus (strain ATCC 29082 / PCC 7421) TaxID=251221 RepID=Q7NNP9_GLOVI|nr:TonB-dependent siderophore receptor [Gloeobacter violaceus]BAC88302.1 gll0361 [Gloeobacter violaceus PCC 7421]